MNLSLYLIQSIDLKMPVLIEDLVSVILPVVNVKSFHIYTANQMRMEISLHKEFHLRIAVTPYSNLRCLFCIPDEARQQSALMSQKNIVELVNAAIDLYHTKAFE